MDILIWFIFVLIALVISLYNIRRKQNSVARLTHLSTVYWKLPSLRLSTICSQAYSECQGKHLKLGRFYLFSRPVIFIADPDILKQIASNWSHFPNRGSYHNDPNELCNLHLFNTKDNQWKIMRSDLGKYFNSTRLSSAIEMFIICAEISLGQYEISLEGKNLQNVDIFQVVHKFSLLVACQHFLYPCWQESNEGNMNLSTVDDLQWYQKLYNPGKWNRFVDVFGYVCPSLLRWFNICDIPVEVFNHLSGILERNLNINLCNNDVFGQDTETTSIYTQLLRSNMKPSAIMGQMIGLFVGSLKSTTTFISFACFELARAPHNQERTCAEISTILEENGDNVVTINTLHKMKFLRNFLDETLRLHSGGPLLIRECSSSCTIDVDGLNFEIEKGTLILASLRDIFKDEQHFINAKDFNPDRFDDDSTKSFPFWPFGLGRRACIGNKFVLFQAQIFLVHLLKKYKLSLSNNDVRKNATKSTGRLTSGIIYLNFHPRM